MALIDRFKDFLRSQNGLVIDMDASNGEDSSLLKSFDYSGNGLTVFAKSGNGSLWASWSYKGTDAVVLISSEGIPFDIAAKDFETFLRLLKYGTGLIYQALMALNLADLMDQTDEEALRRIDKDFLERELSLYQNSFPDYKALYNFLNNENIPEIENPERFFQDSKIIRDDFKQWKLENLNF
ncbi:MAG: hypothetical protein EOO07_36090 [Chitinophagaceae bacterium]|nr:MAG: hypothetical protein EOO07_36090 [Chitinophagaceae bacterium]